MPGDHSKVGAGPATSFPELLNGTDRNQAMEPQALPQPMPSVQCFKKNRFYVLEELRFREKLSRK